MKTPEPGNVKSDSRRTDRRYPQCMPRAFQAGPLMASIEIGKLWAA
jgi:hypothetical protein